METALTENHRRPNTKLLCVGSPIGSLTNQSYRDVYSIDMFALNVNRAALWNTETASRYQKHFVQTSSKKTQKKKARFA